MLQNQKRNELVVDAVRSERLSFARRASTVAFTSINWKYLPKALVLAESLKQFNPDWEFHILLNDYLPGGTVFEKVDLISPINRIGIEQFASWCFSHDVVELCTASKAFYFRLLLDMGYENVFYFDPDIEIFSNLDFLTSELTNSDTLLTPHVDSEAVRDSEILYTEMSVLAHGVFNLGFLGSRNTPNGRRVIDFWCRRMERYCHDDHARGLFTDQKWFNLVPVYFDDVKILKHKGCNVASWNVAHRPISKQNNVFYAGEDELLFFHYSGYDAAVPRKMFEIFGAYNDDIGFMIESYDKKVARMASQHSESQLPWVYASYENGERISRGARQFYRNHLEHRLNYPNPYRTSSEDSFYEFIRKQKQDTVEHPFGLLKRYF